MKKHKIKTAKTRLFAVCWAAAVILTAAFFVTSCGDKMPNAPRITITIEGDGNVTGVPVSIKIGRGLKWAKIKPLAEKKIGFKTGFELKEWRFKEKSTLINDTDVFIKDTVIFAASRKELPKVKLTVKGDANIKGVPAEIKINKGSPWSAAKNQVLAKVSAKAGFEISGWKYDSASGAPVGEADTFGTDKTVYAVSAKIVPKYTITIDGDSYVTGKPAKLENIPEGTLWAAVKAQAEAKITIDDTRDLSKWLLGKNGSEIADNYEIKSAVTAYAETVPTSTPKITITVAANAGAEVTIASPAGFKVNKGSSWADIKAKAEAKVTCNEGYAIKEWKNGSLIPLFDGYTFNSDETVYVETAELKKVTFEVEGGGGTLTAKAEGMPETSTSPIYVLQGKTVTFTAVPDSGYEVDTWTITDGTFESGTGMDGDTTAEVKLTSDISVSVNFSKYVKVNYADLANYLANTASSTEVNYIKVTGTIPIDDFEGSIIGVGTTGAFGAKIKAAAPKKIALKLPKNVTGLFSMSSCFLDCGNLISVQNIPQGVEYMSGCFKGCTSLTETPAIPQGVISMDECFSRCKNLTQAPEIPNSVIGMKSCFSGCENLTQAPVIPQGVTDMSSCFSSCKNLTQAPVIPQGVTDMGYCFLGCTSLTQAPDIPSSVTDMRGCFDGCISLTKGPDIPSKVTNMRGCFDGCISLTKGPDIPSKVTNMQRCFAGCSALKRVKLHCPYNDMFGVVFRGCTALEKGGIQVQSGYFAAYTDSDALNKMDVPPTFNTAEQKKKFSSF